VCDLLASQLQDLHLDWISGGERRDYFFSFQTAALLGKPHLAILKDGRAICSGADGGSGSLAGEGRLNGMTAVHIADLVTEASSYQRAWLPALRSVGARISDSLAVVDRNQGGREILAANGIRLRTLAIVGKDLFAQAQADGLINAQQFAQISRFIDNPQKFMDEFLLGHPGFIDSQLALGGKKRERALQYLEKDKKNHD
jgi:orotate phosphoribosyltransferase